MIVQRVIEERRRAAAVLAVVALACVAALAPSDADASPHARSLDDYRHFRAASIDLLGRMPTPPEVAQFERPDFRMDAWIDEHLAGAPYADRLTRIYMDLLRLEASPAVQYAPDPTTLYRHEILGPDKKPLYVYFRARQRRARDATDGEFCLTVAETGLHIGRGEPPITTDKALPVPQALLDKYTVLVKPWWLYHDYRAEKPTARYDAEWKADAAFTPIEALVKDPDGSPTEAVRVCKEEAQTAEAGLVYTTGRVRPPPNTPFPFGRRRPLPLDPPVAKAHKGEAIACNSRAGHDASIECGCGVGLERCLPVDGTQMGNLGFYFPNHVPLGSDEPIDSARQSSSRWMPYWWSQEARHLFAYVFTEDRDFREILTGKYSFVNGALAQFYRSILPSNCCGPEANFGMMTEKEPLFDPARVPQDLLPPDVGTWKKVEDRGARAAGLLTTPIFLEKFASGRARGAALYNAFLCKSFTAENVELAPSTEPNLMVRPGCSTCHATLEPLAAYFARVEQGGLVYLPNGDFPAKNPTCRKNGNGRIAGFCDGFYDAAFADGRGGTLRGAYGSVAHADAGMAGAGLDVTSSPDFAACATERVASSLLGRPLTRDDRALAAEFTRAFVTGGYKMRPLVRAVLTSSAYRDANNAKTTGAP